jgi:hypothetical protein
MQLKDCPAIETRLSGHFPRSGVDEQTLATPQRDSQQRREAWQQIIDRDLVEWGLDPSQLEDDGLPAPSRAIIGSACRIAQACRDAGWKPPLRVVPTGAGGIMFERREGAVFETLEIRPDGTVELALYENSRLRFRRRLP